MQARPRYLRCIFNALFILVFFIAISLERGEYELSTDWSYSLLEDSQQEFSQLMQGESRGVIKKAELRQFLKPGETLEEAQKVIDEIKSESPKTEDLLGE